MSLLTDSPVTTGKGMRMAGGAGFAAGLAGIVASSCCVLPIAFVGFGLGSAAAAVIPALAALRPYVLAAAILAVGVGWVGDVCGRRASSDGASCCGSGSQRPSWSSH